MREGGESFMGPRNKNLRRKYYHPPRDLVIFVLPESIIVFSLDEFKLMERITSQRK